MTREALQNELFSIFPRHIVPYLSDKSYAILSSKSFLQTSKYVKWLLKIFGILGWRKRFDCDDFAIIWKLFTSLRHARSKNGQSEGVACGIIWYIKGDVGHAINFVKTEEGWKAFDPQEEVFFDLTEEERSSVWFVLF